jgi:peptide/nickel transport system substrate-binding protein
MTQTKPILIAALLASSVLTIPAAALAQDKILRIGMTAADIPRTLGQPDQGFEGNRFTGMTIYDGLTAWDLSKEDEASVVIPNLATSWAVNPDDTTKWVFNLRDDVTFHDGSAFNAEAVVWNVQKVLDESAPHFDASQVGVTASRMPTLRSARVIDEFTVELTTSEPDSFLPINLTNLFMASPAHWQAKFDETGNAEEAWAAFAADPSGTGPFRVTSFVPRERLELAPNTDYWNPARTPKLDGVVLVPLPEANARTAALLSGQVDWIEAPRQMRFRRSKRAGSPFTPIRNRMSGRGNCLLPKARPGWIGGCAMPPTCALTAKNCKSCWAGIWVFPRARLIRPIRGGATPLSISAMIWKKRSA